MATVYYQRDDDSSTAQYITAASNAISGIVNAYQQKRNDKEAEQMMQDISKSKTRSEAMQVIGRASGRLLRDERLFGRVQNYLEAFQPGQNALQVYDRQTGRLKMMPYKIGEVPTQEEFDAYGARLEPFEQYFMKIEKVGGKPEEAPYEIQPLGKHGSREEAMIAAFGNLKPEERPNVTILNEKEQEVERKDLEGAIRMAVENRRAIQRDASNAIAQERNQISREAVEYNKGKGKTQLAKLQEDFSNGKMSAAEFKRAKQKLLESPVLRTVTERLMAKKNYELVDQRAAIEQFTSMANALHDEVAKGGPTLGTAGTVLRKYDSVISQMRSLAEVNSGISAKDVEEYEWPRGLAGASTRVKTLVLNLTMARLAMEGQTGRSVTDRDIQIFNIAESGSPQQILTILDTLVSEGQKNYYIKQNTWADAYGFEIENQQNAPFSAFGNAAKRNAVNEMNKMRRKFLQNQIENPGAAEQLTIESKVQEALSVFDDDEEEELP